MSKRSIIAAIVFAGASGFLAYGINCAASELIAEASQTGLPANFNSLPADEKARLLIKEGAAFLNQGNPRAAADQFRKAITFNPQSAAAHNNLALVLKELSQLPEAEKEARQALKIKADKQSYHFNLGLILQRQNKHAEAESSFREAIRLDPMDPDAHFRLAQTMIALNRPAEAEDEAKLAILMKPNEASYHKVLADSFLQEKKYDESLCEYRTTVELSPQAQDAGDIKTKIDYLKQVLKVK